MKTRHAALSQSSSLATVGDSRFAMQARKHVQTLSQHQDSILIVGPQGSGKESLARGIHAAGSRRQKPFVTLNCKLLSTGNFFDSQVFGHLPGTFAGLNTSSLGLIQAATGGTLFLYEVESLELESQQKLFRTIQEQKVIPLGGSEAIPVDVRVIASTCIDLPLGVSVGMFRSDLFQMLSAHIVESQRLADRMEDLPAMAEEIVREMAAKRKVTAKRFSDSALCWMRGYEWPGNLRELRKAIDIASLEAGEELTARSLRQAMKKVHAPSAMFQRRMAPARFAGFAAMRGSIAARCRVV